jgi:Gpi18-like mannosyltransferase
VYYPLKLPATNVLFENLGVQLRKNKRFLVPIAIVLLIKILVFLWVQLSIGWRPEHFSINYWWETFTIWDGGWYNLIARYGYETISLESIIPVEQIFAFQPLFPATIKGLGLVIGNFDAAQVILSSVFGILWIPIFQLVAEQYLDSDQALSVTLVASLFPTVFVFTSVGYNESLFLILVLSAYYLHLKKRHLYSSTLVALATLTRIMGILLIVPMIIDRLRERKFREAILYIIPAFAVIAWFCYGYLKTANFFVVLEAQKYWLNRVFIGQYVLPTLFQVNPPYTLALPFTEAFVGLAICLSAIFFLVILKVREIDWKLATYSILTFLTIVCCGNILSYPRYFSFIFPLWFLFRMKNNRWLIPIIVALAFTDLIAMYLFARWVFLG